MGENAMQLHFTVTGEFVTNIVRQWFFDEKKDYSVCEELLFSCMGGLPIEQKQGIVRDILEGRKKFVGENEFELVDDGENIRSIIQEFKDREDSVKIELLKCDMEKRPALYIDKLAANKSIKKFIDEVDGFVYQPLEKVAKYLSPLLYNGDVYDIYDHFEYHDSYLQNGMYTVIEPWKYAKIIFNVIKKSNITLEQAEDYVIEKELTVYWNAVLREWKVQGKNYVNMSESEKKVYRRQLKACMMFDMEFPYEFKLEKEEKKGDELVPAMDKIKASFVINDEMDQKFFDKFVRMGFDYSFIGLKETEFLSDYGMIDPMGNWYSCNFGGHEMKANYIISTNVRLYKEYIEYLYENKSIDNKEDYLNLDRLHTAGLFSDVKGGFTPMDFLMEKKWCKVSNSSGGTPYPIVKDEIRGMTKDQEKAFFENQMKFKHMK